MSMMGTIVMGAWHGSARLALVQVDSINSGNSKLLEVFIGLAAFALLAQAAVLVIFAVGAMKAQKEMKGYLMEIHAKAMPLIADSHKLVKDLTPEIKQITTNVHNLVIDLTPDIKIITAKAREIAVKVEQISGYVEEISAVAKDKVEEFSPTVSAYNQTALLANRKAQEQVIRVNGMVSGALLATAEIGQSIKASIAKPVREAGELLDSATNTISSFVKTSSKSVDSVLSGTKIQMEGLFFGLRAFSASLLGEKKVRRTVYPATVYRSEPVSPPVRTEFPGSDIE